MKNLWKRSLSLLLALVMVLGIFPAGIRVEAADDETSEDHSLTNADGLIWLVKSESGGASEAFQNKILNGLLDNMILEAVGAESGTVTYQGMDVGNPLAMAMQQELANQMKDELSAAVADHKLVTFQVDGADKKIAFRNVLTVSIKFDSGLFIEGAGAPDDLNAKVQDILTNYANYLTISHIEEMSIDFADAQVDVQSYDYSWPDPGEEDVVAGEVTVTITADDDETVVMQEVCKIILRETRGLFNVVYESNGEELLNEIVVEGEATPVINDPVRDYYTFQGWEPAVAEKVTADATYTAKWSADVDVNDDGIADQLQSFKVTYTDGVAGVTVFKDQVHTLAWGTDTPEYTPTREYYTFTGWDQTVAETVTQDVVYTAQWEPEIDKNGNEIADQEETFTVTYTDGVADKVVFEDLVQTVAWGKATPLYTPTRQYYNFMGWTPDVSEYVTENVTYTATWEPQIDKDGDGIADQEQYYTVTYLDADGTTVLYTETLIWGSETPVYTPTRNYYTFAGWDQEVAYLVKSNATYTASWKANVDKNGNEIADQEETFIIKFYVEGARYASLTANGDSATPTPDAPTREGWNFAGWVDANGNAIASKVYADAEYYATFTSGAIVTYVVEFKGEEPVTFTLAADEKTGKAIDPGFGAEAGYIWSGWQYVKDNERVTFSFDTVLEGNITLYCTYLPDANGNGKEDGTAEDPYTYYIFKHNSGATMATYTSKVDPTDVEYPSAEGDNQVFLGWVETKTTSDDGCTVTYTYTPNIAVDRNNNDIADGTTDDPYTYYVYLGRSGEELANIEWLEGEGAINTDDIVRKIELGENEKFMGWTETKSTNESGYTVYTYTPNVITDRNDNDLHDGSDEDPYYYDVYLDREGDELVNLQWLTGEARVNGEDYEERIALGENEKFMGWVETTTTNESGYTVYTYTPNVITDRNNNDLDDGSDGDPFVYYVFMKADWETILEQIEWLSGDDVPNPDDVVCPVDASKYECFRGWNKTVGEHEGYVMYVYLPVVIIDENGNGTADDNESSGINMPDGFDSTPSYDEDTKEWIRRNAEGATFTYKVTDLNGNNLLNSDGTFSSTKETFRAEFSAIWNESVMEKYIVKVYLVTYENDGEVSREELPIVYQDYKAVYEPTGIALLSEDAGVQKIEFEWADAALTLKDPVGEVELGKSQYTQEEIYNAIVEAPSYNKEAVTVDYKARVAGSQSVNYDALYNHPAMSAQIAAIVKSYASALPSSFDYGEAWRPVDDAVKYVSVQKVVDDYITEVLDANTKEDGSLDLSALIGLVTGMPDELRERVEAQAELYPFTYNPDNLDIITEDLRITYDDGAMKVSEECTLTLEETRQDTTVKVLKDTVTFTYNRFTKQDLLNNVVLTDEDGNDISDKLEIQNGTEFWTYGVGSYDVTVILKEDETYKANSATFKLVIEKDDPTITINNIVADKGQVNPEDLVPVVTPSDVEIVHVIAGVDMNQLDGDLVKGTVMYKNAGDVRVDAWLKLPAAYNEILSLVHIETDGDVFYTVDQIKQKIENTELKDKLEPALNQISDMLDMVEETIAQKIAVDVEFTLYLTFDADAYPSESGFYLNFAQVMDTVNYTEASANGYLVITPLIAIPNEGGVQLVYSDINDAQNVFTFVTDGTGKALRVAYDGKFVDSQVYYYGLTTRLDPTSAVPTQPGVYVATTIYTVTDENGEMTKIGSDVALVLINLQEASIEITGKTVSEDEVTKTPLPTVTVKDKDGKEIGAAVTVISGTAGVNTDGTNITLGDLSGNVNIDYPDNLDALWNTFCQTAGVDTGKAIYPATVIKFLNACISQIDDKSATAVSTLASLKVNEEYTNKALDMAKAACYKLIEQVNKLPADVSLSFYDLDELNYTETGVYLYCGIITDPDLQPDVNSGVVVIKSADTYVMYDTHVPYDGEEQDIEIDDETCRDGITLIVDRDANEINFQIDSEMTKIITAALAKAGYTLKEGSNASAGTVYTKGEDLAATLTSAIMDEIKSVATNRLVEKLKAKYPDAEEYAEKYAEAVQKLQNKLLNLEEDLSAKLQELDKLGNDTLLIINGTKPVNVGTYEFYGFDYDVAYTSGKLYIEPIHIVLDDIDASKYYGEDDPDLTAVATYYSYDYKAPEAQNKVDITELPNGKTLKDLVSYTVSRTDGNDVAKYDMSVTATLLDNSGNYVLDEIVQDAQDFEILPIEVTVTAYVNGKASDTVKVNGEAEITVKVTDADGNEIDVATAYTITGADDLASALKTAGTYTITPSLAENVANYVVKEDGIVAATLVVIVEEVKIGTIKPDSINLTLDGVIYMNYYVEYEGFAEDFDFAENAGVLVWIGDEPPTKGSQLYVGSENCAIHHGMKYSEEFDGWYGSSDEIYAKHLGDKVYFRAYVEIEEGKYVYAEKAHAKSPEEYCYSRIAADDATKETKELCAALLEYGSAAQVYLNHATNDLVNAALSDKEQFNLEYSDTYVQQAKEPTADKVSSMGVSKSGDIKTVGAALSLLGAIQIDVGFNLNFDMEEVAEAKVLFWTEEAYEAAETLEYGVNQPSYIAELRYGKFGETECYVASSEYVVAKELGKTVYFCPIVEMKDGTVYRGGFYGYSPEQYVYNMLDSTDENLVNLVHALAVYGEKARVLFAN